MVPILAGIAAGLALWLEGCAHRQNVNEKKQDIGTSAEQVATRKNDSPEAVGIFESGVATSACLERAKTKIADQIVSKTCGDRDGSVDLQGASYDEKFLYSPDKTSMVCSATLKDYSNIRIQCK